MSILHLIASKTASLLNRTGDHWIERKLNIRTTGRKEVDVVDAVAYSTFAYWSIGRVLDRLELKSDDVFADLGCGKGRVVCAAATRSITKVVGIEIDEQLCAQARANAQQMRHRQAPIEIMNTAAQQFDYSECTALFLFNPFGAGTLRAVLDAVIESRRTNSKPLRLAYINPRHDAIIRDTRRFEEYDHWHPAPTSRLKFEVTFWRWLS